MKDSPISKPTITKTGYRLSQFKKINDAPPVLCTDKYYGGLDEVLRTGRDRVKLTSCRIIRTPTSGLPHITCKLALSAQKPMQNLMGHG